MTQNAVFNKVRKVHRPSCANTRKEIEHNGTQWKAGNTSCHERNDLGDKDVQREINQRESRRTTDKKISGVYEVSAISTSPSSQVM